MRLRRAHVRLAHVLESRCRMPAPGITGRTRPTKVKKRENVQKRKRDDVDVDKLEQAVQALVRPRADPVDMADMID